ncbi:MAG TPA: hypothetical protein VD884_21575 [Ohtaekwangia sp.]|nr:hypothetical protein [Ohtaekwangia sp.]
MKTESFQLRIILMFMIAIGTFFHTTVTAQYHYSTEWYFGAGASLGTSVQQVASKHEQINGMKLAQEGGSVFIMGGVHYLRAKLETGFYSSSASVPHTVDLLQFAGKLEFHPLQLKSRYYNRWSPYLSVGILNNNHKFHGFYIQDAEQASINQSVGIEPYLGQVSTTYTTAGIGVQYQVPFQRNFLHFFAEVQNGFSLSTKSNGKLQDTFISNTRSINVGFVFGMRRN